MWSWMYIFDYENIIMLIIVVRENPSGFLVVPGESEFQKKIIIRSAL